MWIDNTWKNNQSGGKQLYSTRDCQRQKNKNHYKGYIGSSSIKVFLIEDVCDWTDRKKKEIHNKPNLIPRVRFRDGSVQAYLTLTL